jgi:hypothetical protein
VSELGLGEDAMTSSEALIGKIEMSSCRRSQGKKRFQEFRGFRRSNLPLDVVPSKRVTWLCRSLQGTTEESSQWRDATATFNLNALHQKNFGTPLGGKAKVAPWQF